MKRLSGNYLDYFLHQLIISLPIVVIIWIIASFQQNKLVLDPIVLGIMLLVLLTITLIGFLILLIKIPKKKLTTLYYNEKNNTFRFGNESFTFDEIEGVRIIDKGTGRLILDLIEFQLIKNNLKSKVIVLDRIIIPFLHYHELPRSLTILCKKNPGLENIIKTNANSAEHP